MTDYRSKNLIPFYFAAFATVVVLVFAVSIASYYFDFYSRLSVIKKYLKQGQQVTAQIEKPVIRPLDPTQGPADAPVTVVEYSDFTCPTCKQVDPELTALTQYYGNRVQLVFKGIAITSHPEKNNALNAAYCAAEQRQFWPYKTALFEKQDTLSANTYTEIAANLQLNLQQFSSCLDAKKYQAVVTANIEEALKVGVASSPTLFINGTKEDTLFTFASLKNTIDAIIQNNK